jgi:hypothetical protein
MSKGIITSFRMWKKHIFGLFVGRVWYIRRNNPRIPSASEKIIQTARRGFQKWIARIRGHAGNAATIK